MVLINGRKFACEACIRGHRASSCAHTNRQLQLVRKKGRPASQCDVCRSKRISSSFHGRCDCNADEDDASSVSSGPSRPRRKRKAEIEKFTPYGGESSATTSDENAEGSSEGGVAGDVARSTKGKHSLDLLMNPCQCRSTGICTCCSRTKEETTHATVDDPASCGCNGGDKCCSDGDVKCGDEAIIEVATGVVKSCCGGGGGGGNSKGPSRKQDLDLFENVSPEHAAILEPECQCGVNCSCPGCINDGVNNAKATSDEADDPDCPNKCMDCSACFMGLSRPSGIDVVDRWMEQDKKRAAEGEAQGPGVLTKRLKTNQEVKLKSMPAPPPPFPIAERFHQEHFEDPNKRHYFAQHLAAVQQGIERDVKDLPFGERLPGESNEEWQLRHGYEYLTPESIEIFDHARRFKEQKALAERQQEQDSRASERDLASLRQKALAARR